MLGVSFGTVSDVEVLWTLLAFVGAVFSGINIGAAWGDYSYLKRQEIVNGRAYLARNALIAEVCRFVIQNIFVAIGLGAMTLTPPNPDIELPLKLKIFSVLFQWGFITASALLTFKTWLLYRTRKILREGDIDH